MIGKASWIPWFPLSQAGVCLSWHWMVMLCTDISAVCLPSKKRAGPQVPLWTAFDWWSQWACFLPSCKQVWMYSMFTPCSLWQKRCILSSFLQKLASHCNTAIWLWDKDAWSFFKAHNYGKMACICKWPPFVNGLHLYLYYGLKWFSRNTCAMTNLTNLCPIAQLQRQPYPKCHTSRSQL